MMTNSQTDGCIDFCSPVRNRYFYGKLLDVFHFDLEQNYFNTKRWTLNRLVTGYGVIYGLNVTLGSDKQSIIVTPGLAIDRCGHEIIVCRPSDPQPLPLPTSPSPQPTPATGDGKPTPASGAAVTASTPAIDCCDSGTFYHARICYVECPSDPVPALGGDCDTQSACSSGAIREHYKVEIVEGKLCPARTTSRITDVMTNGTLNYTALANYITNAAPGACDECCIPLANIRIPDSGGSYDIDIAVRPIVYTNDLLYEMILALNPGQSQSSGGKP
jgi:hypothetical protein